MARRGDEAKAEPLDVVEGVAERVDLEFAGVARARVDVPDREAAPERRAAAAFTVRGEGRELGIVGRRGAASVSGGQEALESVFRMG